MKTLRGHKSLPHQNVARAGRIGRGIQHDDRVPGRAAIHDDITGLKPGRSAFDGDGVLHQRVSTGVHEKVGQPRFERSIGTVDFTG